MNVYHRLEDVPPHPAGSCVALGVFDGVHLGHRAVLQAAVRQARQAGWRSVALTFHPHPQQVVARVPDPFLILPLEERLRRIATLGLDAALVLRFDKALRRTEPEEFVRAVLVDGLGAKAAVCGPDFRFGRDRRGDAELLRQLGSELGFSVEVCPPVEVGGQRVSSSRIRALLREGRAEEACELLAHHEAVACAVHEGRVLLADGSRLPKAPVLPGEPPEQAARRAVGTSGVGTWRAESLGRLAIPEFLEVWHPYRLSHGSNPLPAETGRWEPADRVQLEEPFRRVLLKALEAVGEAGP
ncbi:MAG: bifunctional riboflavin kinase/FMN adenylyltransferase [Armatimonadota bacterium]|nr:bifunctional riboflavin kinase/FMN adenylyltransferase [Armatimonadota bacterium]MDW8155427.1 bifunctional riboflavin kinase/FMN adenylyltransferase [Armatimonadota bacterium]